MRAFSVTVLVLKLAAIVSVVPALCLGQASFTGALLQGTVQDSSGGAIPGANVTMTNDATNISKKTVTDQAGRYVFNDLQPASYTVKLEAAGLKDCTGINFVSNGQRNSSADVLLDGAIIAAPEGGQGSGQNSLRYSPSPEIVQEFKIQNNSFSAEYGSNGGTTVNIVTKSGTNEFHGSGYWFTRRPELNASDFYSNLAAMANGRLADGSQRPNLIGSARSKFSIHDVVDGRGTFFNVNAFSDPGDQIAGNAPRYDGDTRSDGIRNLDASLFKNLHITEKEDPAISRGVLKLYQYTQVWESRRWRRRPHIRADLRPIQQRQTNTAGTAFRFLRTALMKQC